MLKTNLLHLLNNSTCRCMCVSAANIKNGLDQELQNQQSAGELVNKGETEKKTNTKAVRSRNKISPQIENYFKNNKHITHLQTLFPAEYLKMKRADSMKTLYLTDPLIAKRYVDAIEPTLYKNPNVIIDNNAGIGLLTKELLTRNKVKKIRIHESTPHFRTVLKDIVAMNPNKVELFNKDLLQLWKLSYQDKFDNLNRVEKLLKGVTMRQWKDEPAMTILGALDDDKFIKYMILSLITNSDIVAYGRVEMYVVISPKIYQVLTATNKHSYMFYRATSVLFQLFFDYEHLETFPRSAYIPWENKKKYKIKEHLAVDKENLYLVRINFKKTYPVFPEHLVHFYHFIRQSMSKRKSKVIANLEKWFPNAGLKLLLLDIERTKKHRFSDLTIFTEFGELNPKQLLYLFREFMSWPEIAESPFMDSVEDTLTKLTTHPDQVDQLSSETENISTDETKNKELGQVDIVKKLVESS